MHGRGLLHLDVTPANILLGGADATPELIDFSLSVLEAEPSPRPGDTGGLVGTLPYIAPELTGRMAQPVDHRADLYELGATLYELAAGQPPFGRGDTLALLHDHLATVPTPPSQLAGELPPLLSDIIMRLLEKEPGRRYQSAEGLADDLDRLHGLLTGGDPATFTLGATDISAFIAPPSRPVGRQREWDVLQAAFGDAVEGRCPGLLIEGAAGVGKTALIEQLHPTVLAQGGVFVASSFDPHRGGSVSSALLQVLRGIAARLLAEPEAELAALRMRLQTALGARAGALLAVVPELTELLGADPPAAAPAHASLGAAGLAFLQAVASPSRPLVVVLDDLQWAPAAWLRLIGGLFAAGGWPGLMVVAATRALSTETACPLTAALLRLEAAGTGPRRLRLENLGPNCLSELVGGMLRMPADDARPLAAVIGARTGGNPFDTVELLNGLRRDGVLQQHGGEWHWDGAAVHRHVGSGDVSGLLTARLRALPDGTRTVLATLACLGAEATVPLLAAATGKAAAEVEHDVAPAVAEGLLIPAATATAGTAPVGFRFGSHRVLELAYDGTEASARPAWHLALARRLAAVPAFEAEAAAQYLAAAQSITEPNEARRAAALLEAAAAAAAQSLRHDIAERYHAGAIGLLGALPGADPGALVRLRTARLTALYCLGHYDEADLLFAELGEASGDPLPLAEASCVQVLSLCNRARHQDAVRTGLAMLARLGIRHPGDELKQAVLQGLGELREWIAAEVARHGAPCPATGDPLARATARLISRMLPTAQLLDPLTGAWLAVESHRLWARHGVCPELVANLARSASSPIMFAGDHKTAYSMGRHAVTLGAALEFEPETSLARQNFATFALHWFEPLDNTIAQCAAAAGGLTQAGEVQALFINHVTALGALFDCAPTLEGFAAELAAARDFALRSGNTAGFESLHTSQLLLQVLTGESEAAPMLSPPDPQLALKPLSLFGALCARAIAALMFDDPLQLARSSAGLVPLLGHVAGAYRCMTARLARALSLARDARQPGAAVGGPLPSEFHGLRQWFAERAADAPANFQHLLHLIDAEAAWTAGAAEAAIRAFDLALQCCNAQVRPWHQALIAERAGLFHLAHNLDYAGRRLLRDARDRYAAWAPGRWCAG